MISFDTVTVQWATSVQVKISTRHGQLSDEAQRLIREKGEKLLHFFGRVSMIEFTIDLKDPTAKAVELLVNAEHKHDFIARESHPELQGAVDLAIHKLERQLTRYKEKIQDHRRDTPTGEFAGRAAAGR